MKKLNILFLDDVRKPEDILPKHVLETVSCVTVRDYNSFINAISNEQWKKYDLFCMDHDIGNYKNGNDCLKALVDELRKNYDDVPDIAIHSMNPVGKQNMINTLNNYVKEKKLMKH